MYKAIMILYMVFVASLIPITIIEIVMFLYWLDQ